MKRAGSEPGPLEQSAIEAYDRRLGDHRRALLLALAQLLPAGGTFAELYGTYIPTRSQSNQLAFLKALARAVDQLGERLDEGRILTDDYAAVFEDVLETIRTRRGLEKRAYYASVLANALTADAPGIDVQERFIATLDALRPSHLRLLARIVREVERLEVRPQGSIVAGPSRGVYMQLPADVDSDELTRDWLDLVRLNILEDGGKEPVQWTGGSAPNLSATITDFGQRFATFVGATEDPGI